MQSTMSDCIKRLHYIRSDFVDCIKRLHYIRSDFVDYIKRLHLMRSDIVDCIQRLHFIRSDIVDRIKSHCSYPDLNPLLSTVSWFFTFVRADYNFFLTVGFLFVFQWLINLFYSHFWFCTSSNDYFLFILIYNKKRSIYNKILLKILNNPKSGKKI